MRNFKRLEKDKRRSDLLHGVEYYNKNTKIPVAVKEAAKESGMSEQDLITIAIKRYLEHDKDRKSSLLGC